MVRRCDRPGCSAPAAVAYGLDAADAVVYLDRLDPADPMSERVGALCEHHAATLRAPRGWFVVDQREDAPRLFRLGPEVRPDHLSPSVVDGEPASDASAPHRRPRPEDATEELALFAEP